MKRTLKNVLSITLSIIILSSLALSALAATYTVYSNITTTRLTSVPTGSGICTAVGGISIGKNKNSMFCVKSSGDDTVAKFFYFPDLSNINSSTTRIFTLYDAGHANAMTIDGTYVYITCWRKPESANSAEAKNKIMLIPRAVIAATSNGGTLPAETATTDGYKVITAKVENTDPATKDSVPYVDFDYAIASISLYNGNKSFIIQYTKGVTDNDFCYTTAELITYNGEEIFLVSEDADDIFYIKNNLKYQDATEQDICYSAGNGFFLGAWYNDYNSNKSVILWSDIDSIEEYKTVNGVQYRYYTPDLISIDKSNSTYNGITKFSKFEIESLAFTKAGEMIAAFNVANTQNYIDAYYADTNDNPPADSIFKITHDDGENFVLP